MLFAVSVERAVNSIKAGEKIRSELAVDQGNCKGCREKAMSHMRLQLTEIERRLSLMNPRAVRVAKRVVSKANTNSADVSS